MCGLNMVALVMMEGRERPGWVRMNSVWNSALFTVSWEHLNSYEASFVLPGNVFDEQLSL